ncbi:MAG TPA: ABC transporter permease, partial [Pilimelia sp.]|nr:ABC transporter permease [Pilimelia sp.]
MLSLATVRERWTGFAGSFVALCLGVALLSVGALLLTSARPQVPDRYAGAAVLVHSPAVSQADAMFTENRPWSPETTRSLVDRLGAIAGVAAVVTDRSFYAQPVVDGQAVGDPRVAARQGHGWSSAALAPYRLRSGRAPQRADEVVLDHRLGLRPGTPVTLLTATGPAGYVVSGTLDGAGVYLTDAAAAALAPGVRALGLLTGAADVGSVEAAARAVVGTAGSVVSGAGRAALEPKSDARGRWIASQVITATAGLAAFVSIFVVASTFAFSVLQRRRLFALLRLVGASARQVRRVVLGEGLIVGTAGAAAGVLLGAGIAPAVGALLVKVGLEPPTFAVRITALPLAGAFGLGLVVALAGVWSAARRAAAARPVDALRAATVEQRPMTRPRWVFGTLFLIAGLALSVVTATADAREMINLAGVAAMALIVAMSLLAPVTIPPLVRLLTWPLAGASRAATGLLVREGALVAVRRIASTAAPVLVAVGFVVLITGFTLTSLQAYSAGRATALHAGAMLVPDGTPGLSDAAASAAPGVSLLPTTLYLGGDVTLRGSGVSPPALAAGRGRLDVVAGSLTTLPPDAIAVSAGTAARLGWRPGSTASLTFADGRTADLRVVAVLTDASAPVPALL